MTIEEIKQKTFPVRLLAYKKSNMYYKDITVIFVSEQLFLFVDNWNGVENTLELAYLSNYKYCRERAAPKTQMSERTR